MILLILVLATGASARETGTGRETAVIGDMSIAVFTYRPAGCAPAALLFVFHGADRNAAGYRDRARPLASRACLVVLAPLFDRDRFPNWRYHRGGIVHKDRVLPRAQWAVTLVAGLVDWARRREDRHDLPYYLFGHSAGGQFLSRVAAYTRPDAARIVIANPSSHVAPSIEEAAPYGMGGLSEDEKTAEAGLRQYLSLPVTVYLGENDIGHRLLGNHPAARRQGANRFERGQHVYRAALALAKRKGWPFNWRLVTAPGVGHSSRRMLAPSQAMQALAPGGGATTR
jgi:dienelactone hydrolase